MKRSIDFLNRALETYKGTAIAKLVGAKSSGTVGNWKERGHLSPYYAAKVAELIGEDPAEAAAIAGAESEPDSEKRAYLLNLANERYNSARVGSLAQLVEQRTLNP
jgi:hypothetical protein